MTRHETSLAYAARIERIAVHIADHLDDRLDLESLADIACFSSWHFHRVYAGVTGETVQETVRRLRLHRAAVDLARSPQPLARLARRAGYGSVAAFTRAFAAAYGMPPAAWRERAHVLRPGKPNQGEKPMNTNITGAVAPLRLPVQYDVTVETIQPINVIALAHRGDYQEIGKSFDRMFAWAGPRHLIGPRSCMFGVYYDDPASVPLKDLRSEACVAVPEGTEPGPDMRWITIAGGRVAKVVHKGPYADLDVAYAYLFRNWLPASGEEPGDAPCFEEYLNNPRLLPPQEWLTAVHLPLKG